MCYFSCRRYYVFKVKNEIMVFDVVGCLLFVIIFFRPKHMREFLTASMHFEGRTNLVVFTEFKTLLKAMTPLEKHYKITHITYCRTVIKRITQKFIIPSIH